MLVRGKRFCKLQNYLPITSPNVEKKKGRPQTKKMRGANEPRSVILGENVTRKGYHVTCSVCNKQGHNKATTKQLVRR